MSTEFQRGQVIITRYCGPARDDMDRRRYSIMTSSPVDSECGLIDLNAQQWEDLRTLMMDTIEVDK